MQNSPCRALPMVFLLLVITACADETPQSSASASAGVPWQIPATESFVLHSVATNRDIQVSVAVPRGYAESSGRYPALYVLDANAWFPVGVEVARVLAIGPKEQPN